MAELVIKGGLVVDGSGGPPQAADVAVTGGRIEAVGPDLEGSRTIDASGQVVAPGFIDLHTHYDAQVLWDPGLTPSSWHGVTSVVAGNCGFSLAPCHPDQQELVMRTLERVEDMPYASLASGIDWDFETYGEYLATVAKHRTAINFGGYVGHTTVRLYVMGEDAYEREATAEEISAMADVVTRSLQAGALGFSTSTIGLHRGWKGKPVPSNIASRAEIEALMRAVGHAGRGVVQFSPDRNADWIYELQREIGCNLSWSALIAYPDSDRSRGYRAQLAALTEARRHSDNVWAQVTSRPISAELTMIEPVAFYNVPAFGALSEADDVERRRAYASPAWRAEAWAQLESHSYRDPRWEKIRVATSDAFPEMIGRPLVDVAAERGTNALDAMLDLALADDLSTRFHITLGNDDAEAVASLLRADGCVLGLSDAGAHVGQLCDAVLPTDFLSGWVRDAGVLPLEAGVRKLTGELADVLGLSDRGYLRAGQAADLVVFDLDKLAPGPLNRVTDLPGGATRLLGDQPTGITHMVVNGTPTCLDGRHLTAELDELPGRLLGNGPR